MHIYISSLTSLTWNAHVASLREAGPGLEEAQGAPDEPPQVALGRRQGPAPRGAARALGQQGGETEWNDVRVHLAHLGLRLMWKQI